MNQVGRNLSKFLAVFFKPFRKSVQAEWNIEENSIEGCSITLLSSIAYKLVDGHFSPNSP
jgi:hypothetical protein